MSWSNPFRLPSRRLVSILSLGVFLLCTGSIVGVLSAQESQPAKQPEKQVGTPTEKQAEKQPEKQPVKLPEKLPENVPVKIPGPQDLAPPLRDAAVPQNNPKAIEIIKRYVDAVGGRATLDLVKDKTQKFDTIKHAPTGETKAVLNLYLKKDYKVREEWDLPGFNIKDQPLKFVQVYNGVEGWVQMLGTVSPLEGRTLSIFVWDKPIDDFFCHWDEDGYTVDYVGDDAVTVQGGKEPEAVDVIETTDFTGKNKARYFFSKASGLLAKREWREQGQNGFDKKEAFYTNYKRIPFSDDASKGIQVALLQTIKSNGEVDTERKYTELAINTGLKDAIFERPPGPLFKGAIGDAGKSLGIPGGDQGEAGPESPLGAGEGDKPADGSGARTAGPKPIPIRKSGQHPPAELKKDGPVVDPKKEGDAKTTPAQPAPAAKP